MYYNNKKLALSIFWVVLGLTLLVLNLVGVLDDLYSSMGIALIIVGGLQVWRNLKYRRDPEYREKIDIAAGDERNRAIRMQSWAWAGYIVVLGEMVASLVAFFMGVPWAVLALCALLAGLIALIQSRRIRGSLRYIGSAMGAAAIVIVCAAVLYLLAGVQPMIREVSGDDGTTPADA